MIAFTKQNYLFEEMLKVWELIVNRKKCAPNTWSYSNNYSQKPNAMQNPKNLKDMDQQENCIILTLIIQMHTEDRFNG